MVLYRAHTVMQILTLGMWSKLKTTVLELEIGTHSSDFPLLFSKALSPSHSQANSTVVAVESGTTMIRVSLCIYLCMYSLCVQCKGHLETWTSSRARRKIWISVSVFSTCMVEIKLCVCLTALRYFPGLQQCIILIYYLFINWFMIKLDFRRQNWNLQVQCCLWAPSISLKMMNL